MKRVQRKYRTTEEQHAYLQMLAVKLSIASGKKMEISDVLGGIIDFYRLEQNEKTK